MSDLHSQRTRKKLWATRFCAIAIGMALLSGCGDDDDPVQQSQQKLDQSIAKLRTAMEDAVNHTVPSLSVLIQTPEARYFTSSTAPNAPSVTPDTYFRFGSNTKTFTATAILKMHQDGWLNYTDHIVDLIPGSNLTYAPATPAWNIPYKNSITIRQLLQHSAGVYDLNNDPAPGCEDPYVACIIAQDPNHQFSADELVAQLTRHNLSYFAPGTENHHYSNTGYTILGEIIARVYTYHSDGVPKTYTDYLRDHVHGPAAPVPLNLPCPFRADDQRLPAPYVCGAIYWPNGGLEEHCADNMSAHLAEGNGYGTMAALNTYIRSLIKGENVLSRQSIEWMMTDSSKGNPNYALGGVHTSNAGFGHAGATKGYLSQMVYDQNLDVSVIALLPVWSGLSDESWNTTMQTIQCAIWTARDALGYPGKPADQTCPGD